MAHKRSTAPLNFAHKRSATLAWHLKFIPGWLTKGLLRGKSSSTLGLLTKQRPATLEWQLLPLSFNLARLTKGVQRWNGSFLFKILPSGGSQKVCYLGMALSSSKFYRQGGSQKRSATSGDKRSATVLHRMYDQISKSPLTRLASKRPGRKTKGPEDQRTRGPREQRTKGPEDQGTKGPGDEGTRTKGPKDQATGNQQTRAKGVGGILFLIFLIGINFLFDRYPYTKCRI